MLPHFTVLPDRDRNKSLLGPLIGLGLLGFATAARHVAERQIVAKRHVSVALHMAAEMGEFVEEAEPEAINAIVAEREAHHWRSVAELESGAVEVGSRQVPNDDQRD